MKYNKWNKLKQIRQEAEEWLGNRHKKALLVGRITSCIAQFLQRLFSFVVKLTQELIITILQKKNLGGI